MTGRFVPHHAALAPGAQATAGAPPGPASERGGRIGPNAIVRVAEALEARLGAAVARSLFASAGLLHHWTQPPAEMVNEADVACLQAELRAALGADLARVVACDAGRRTGDYLLAHRIPRPARLLLELLPPPLAARALARAVARHAWTFAGSGTFEVNPGPPFRLAIAGCPLCREIRADGPACDYYAATFERIFRALASPRARVTETACQAAGAAACEFTLTW